MYIASNFILSKRQGLFKVLLLRNVSSAASEGSAMKCCFSNVNCVAKVS